MNQEQKECIVALRSKGASFGKIAKEMGLSINTVKSFCRRKQTAAVVVQPEQNVSIENHCLQCDRILKQSDGHRPRKFCSDSCRRTWWLLHPEQAQRKAWHVGKCNYCGKTFSYYGNRERRYCSLICYREHRSKMGGGAGV